MTKSLQKKRAKPIKKTLAQKRAQTRSRVQKRRDALRAMGLRPIQIWVPDTRKKGFLAECRRQSLLIKNDQREAEMMDWWEAATDREGWEA